MEDKQNITALSKEILVRLMVASGNRAFTMEFLEQNIAAGAPVNPDGTIDLFDYGAWLYAGGEDARNTSV